MEETQASDQGDDLGDVSGQLSKRDRQRQAYQTLKADPARYREHLKKHRERRRTLRLTSPDRRWAKISADPILLAEYNEKRRAYRARLRATCVE